MLTKEVDMLTTNFDVTDFGFWLHESPNHPPVNIIHESSAITACFNWTQKGLFAKNGGFAAGTFYRLRVYLEQMGPGEAGGKVFQRDIPIVQNYAPADAYEYDFKHVPPGWDSLTEGVYKMVITLNLYTPNGAISWFHSFDEVGFIEVVKP